MAGYFLKSKINKVHFGRTQNYLTMQTILGSGGAIGNELATCLTEYTEDIRLVSRNPKKVNHNDQIFKADLMVADQVDKAVEGSEVVYLTAGLLYKAKVWEEQWPRVMRNVIEACKKHHSKLVFFDNIYVYDRKFMGNITEEVPINPYSKKGKVRAQIAKMIFDEVEAGNLKALIARSADFYGPSTKNSVLNETVFQKLKAGKSAIWLCGANYKHSFTYTPDAAFATALLGNTQSAWNQSWHLPTAKNPLTGKEWVKAFSSQLAVKPKSFVVPKFLILIMGVFNPLMKELSEMLYQYDRDYIFNSNKFESQFDFRPTPYLEGIKKIILDDAVRYISKH